MARVIGVIGVIGCIGAALPLEVTAPRFGGALGGVTGCSFPSADAESEPLGTSHSYFSTKPGSIETNPILVVEVSNVKLISI
jgi:hypothetical protein